IGAGLLFTDGCHGDALMSEKRRTFGYGTVMPAQPNPTAAPPERGDALPPIITTFAHRRSLSPISPFDVSPLSATFPRSPAPAIPRRSSQESLGGASIASSGIFSASMLSFPMPPSAAPSCHGSPPPTAHDRLPELALRCQHRPVPPPKPANPSNWKKPAGWD
ncbi:hypothetical protein BT67DRAFT_388618, partial [Trichocladium antarcticum]